MVGVWVDACLSKILYVTVTQLWGTADAVEIP